MMRKFSIFIFLMTVICISSVSSIFSNSVAMARGLNEGIDLDNFVYLDTKYGRSIIVLYPNKAPLHVERVKKLVREGFYDGIVFHRVIRGFMAQTGDPTGTGTGGSDYENLPAEFNDIIFNRGVIGAARTSDPNTANSQFFITFQASHFLNGQYTVWGRVVHGMEFIDKIKIGQGQNGMVDNPDKIVSMKIVADSKDPLFIDLQNFVPGFEDAPRQRHLPKID